MLPEEAMPRLAKDCPNWDRDQCKVCGTLTEGFYVSGEVNCLRDFVGDRADDFLAVGNHGGARGVAHVKNGA